MGFFSNIFNRKKKLLAAIDEKLNTKLEDFEINLFKKLAEVFPKKVVVEEEREETIQGVDLFKPVPIIKALHRVNDTISCYLFNGNVYEVQGDVSLLKQIREARTQQEIEDLMAPDLKIKREREERERIAKLGDGESTSVQEYQKRVQLTPIQLEYAKELVENTFDFEVVNGELRMIGIPLSIPGLLVNKFAELIKEIYSDTEDEEDYMVWTAREQKLDEQYQALVNFWLWLANNPNASARRDLFKFLQNHDLRVNKNGFFFTYRRVRTKSKESKVDKELQAFVGAEFLKIKTKWKKNVNNFSVAQNEAGELKTFENTKVPKEWDIIGGLKELHESPAVNESVVYTDAYTGTMTIQIGKEVRIDRKDCDENNLAGCSFGLHSGNKNFGFSGNGDTQILCLINPMDVVSVPIYDFNKMRSCAYLPVAVLDKAGEEASFLADADVLELADEYLVEQVDRLPRMLAESHSSAEEVEVIQTANVRLQEVAIDVKATLKNRVVKV